MSFNKIRFFASRILALPFMVVIGLLMGLCLLVTYLATKLLGKYSGYITYLSNSAFEFLLRLAKLVGVIANKLGI